MTAVRDIKPDGAVGFSAAAGPRLPESPAPGGRSAGLPRPSGGRPTTPPTYLYTSRRPDRFIRNVWPAPAATTPVMIGLDSRNLRALLKSASWTTEPTWHGRTPQATSTLGVTMETAPIASRRRRPRPRAAPAAAVAVAVAAARSYGHARICIHRQRSTVFGDRKHVDWRPRHGHFSVTTDAGTTRRHLKRPCGT